MRETAKAKKPKPKTKAKKPSRALLKKVTFPNPDTGHNNFSTQLATFLEEVDQLGEQSALGATALTALAQRVIAAASDGLIEPQAAPGIYQRYAAASKKAGGTPGSIKTNVSKIEKLIELGNLNDGPQAAEHAARLREKIANAKSPFEGLVEVARRRCKEKRKLNDDEISMALTKAAPKPKADSTGWEAVAKKVGALVATKDKEGLDDAIAIRDKLETYIEACQQVAVVMH